jgi:hypothetical protein
MAHRFDSFTRNIPANCNNFTLHIAEVELVGFRKLLELSRVSPETWWNQYTDNKF